MKKEKELIRKEIGRQKFLLNKAVNEGNVEAEKEHREILMRLIKDLCEIEKDDSERVDGRMKAVGYVGGTVLGIAVFAGLSLLYACIDTTGSTGREAKLFLKDAWKNRPILK